MIPDSQGLDNVFLPYDGGHIFLRGYLICHYMVFGIVVMQLQPLDLLIESFGSLNVQLSPSLPLIQHSQEPLV